MRQRWSALLFLHWPVDPALIAARLPTGLTVDTFAGQAYLGIVPFHMQRVRPVGLPPVPWLSWFHELNLRTYVLDSKGKPGVWFFSLDCNQPIAVELARRAFHLPYQHARMCSFLKNGRLLYQSTRRGESITATFEYALPTQTRTATEGSLEAFLVERYRLFSTDRSGNLHSGLVHHAPYQIAPADCTQWSTEALRLNAFPQPTTPPTSTLVAAPVDVRIYPLRKHILHGG
jgi:uncharacterized protein YqjF (DUF2071 family)